MNSSEFLPGRDIHPLQAQQALRNLSSARGVKIIEVHNDSVLLEIQGTISHFCCSAATRLAALLESGRCALSDGSSTYGLLADGDVLIVPASDEGCVMSRTPPVHADVTIIVNGAAISSPTDGGSWHLFGVTLAQTPPSG